MYQRQDIKGTSTLGTTSADCTVGRENPSRDQSERCESGCGVSSLITGKRSWQGHPRIAHFSDTLGRGVKSYTTCVRIKYDIQNRPLFDPQNPGEPARTPSCAFSPLTLFHHHPYKDPTRIHPWLPNTSTMPSHTHIHHHGITHDPDSCRAFMPATSYASSSHTEEIPSPYDWHHYTPRSRASPCPSYASSSSLYGAYPTYTKTSFAASCYYDELLSEAEAEEEDGEEEPQQAYKPAELSMKETVRRQLQTVSFTVGIKVFRARRRLRRVLHRRHGALA
ncbi:hypothetical protein BDZ89DRAFT_1060645 [Hymenopellis radicata]|nr:hypothetical protein BDZ89DRAFT_1060645 [Hymenopellis radicata]